MDNIIEMGYGLVERERAYTLLLNAIDSHSTRLSDTKNWCIRDGCLMWMLKFLVVYKKMYYMAVISDILEFHGYSLKNTYNKRDVSYNRGLAALVDVKVEDKKVVLLIVQRSDKSFSELEVTSDRV